MRHKREKTGFYHVKNGQMSLWVIIDNFFVAVSRVVRLKVKQSQSMEMGLLKTSERDHESEEEI